METNPPSQKPIVMSEQMPNAQKEEIVLGKAYAVDSVPSGAVLPSGELKFLVSRDGKSVPLGRQEMQPVEGKFNVKYREGKEPLYSLMLFFKVSKTRAWVLATAKLTEEGLCKDDGTKMHFVAQQLAYEPNVNPDFEGHFLTSLQEEVAA